MNETIAGLKQCAIVVRQGRDDQRVGKLLSLIPDAILVGLFSGETGKTYNVLRPDIAGHAKAKPTSVDFVFLHREDEACWEGVKEQLSDGTGKVFCFHGEGAPRPLDDPASLPILRQTTGAFEISTSDMMAIISHVFEGGPVPACCRTASSYLLALRGLCEGFAMSQRSLEDLASQGISNPMCVRTAAGWFVDPSNWRSVLGDGLLRNLADENVSPSNGSPLPVLDEILERIGKHAKSLSSSKGQSETKITCDFTPELVEAIKIEVCDKLKTHA